MIIASWNTYLAPLMPDRDIRLPRVLATLTRIIRDQGADVLVLQELHGYARGPLGTCLAGAGAACAAWARRWCGDGVSHALQVVIESMCVLEGALCPISYFSPYRQAVIRHCAVHGLTFASPIVRQAQGQLGDHGILVVSRRPCTQVESHPLPCDMIHTPGAVRFNVQGCPVALWGVHLLPRLPDTKWTYRVTNALNQLSGLRPDTHADTNLHQLQQWLKEEQERTGCGQLILGDFNASVPRVQQILPASSVLVSPDANTLCPHDEEYPICIDHIWMRTEPGRKKEELAVVHAEILYTTPADKPLVCTIGSDHYPVLARIQQQAAAELPHT